MERVEIKSLFTSTLENNTLITVAGWVKTSRESKNIAFLEVNDGSCFKNLQVILEASKFHDQDAYKKVANAPVGSSIIVKGNLIDKDKVYLIDFGYSRKLDFDTKN